MSTREEVQRDYAEYKEKGRVWGQVPPERITKIKFPRPSQAVIDRYLALPDLTTTVSDMLDGWGIHGVVAASHIKPLLPGKKIVGTAVTLRSMPERKTATQGAIDKEPIKMSTREIYYLSEPGDVLVADFGGNLDVSNMGGQSSRSATCQPSARSTIPYGQQASHPSPASSAWKRPRSMARCACTTSLCTPVTWWWPTTPASAWCRRSVSWN